MNPRSYEELTGSVMHRAMIVGVLIVLATAGLAGIFIALHLGFNVTLP